MKRSDIEIMAPAGSYESLHAAIDAGANSVYFGVGRLNMRAQSAANFTLEDMGQIVSIAREHGVKSYLTVNTVIYDEEIETLHATIDRACEVEPCCCRFCNWMENNSLIWSHSFCYPTDRESRLWQNECFTLP